MAPYIRCNKPAPEHRPAFISPGECDCPVHCAREGLCRWSIAIPKNKPVRTPEQVMVHALELMELD